MKYIIIILFLLSLTQLNCDLSKELPSIDSLSGIPFPIIEILLDAVEYSEAF